jgi:hypothetical protein
MANTPAIFHHFLDSHNLNFMEFISANPKPKVDYDGRKDISQIDDRR